MQYADREQQLQDYTRELFESMTWPLDQRKAKTREIRTWVENMAQPDYGEALDRMYLAFLIYRGLLGRGSTWLLSVNNLCLERMALAKDRAEYERLVGLWWEHARSKEKRTRKSKHVEDPSEEQVTELQARIIRRLFDDEMETLFAMTGDIESMPFEGDQRERFDTKYKAEYEKMRVRFSGGDALTFPFWCREHLVTLQELDCKQSDWICSNKWHPMDLFPIAEAEQKLSRGAVDYADPTKYTVRTYVSRGRRYGRRRR